LASYYCARLIGKVLAEFETDFICPEEDRYEIKVDMNAPQKIKDVVPLHMVAWQLSSS
jgi:hypothetical protein